jgi:hypothetical protein
MRKLAAQGMIENGCGELLSGTRVPEMERAYVLASDAEALLMRHIAGPHLVDPQQAMDFQMEVIENVTETGV